MTTTTTNNPVALTANNKPNGENAPFNKRYKTSGDTPACSQQQHLPQPEIEFTHVDTTSTTAGSSFTVLTDDASVTDFNTLPLLTELVHRLQPPEDFYVNDERVFCDLDCLLMGAFIPLHGFMTLSQYKSVKDSMKLVDVDGTTNIFPIPIVLPIPFEKFNVTPTTSTTGTGGTAGSAGTAGSSIRLRDSTGTVVATIAASSVWRPCLKDEARQVLGTDSSLHPGCRYLDDHFTGCLYVGGEFLPHSETNKACGIRHHDFPALRVTPKEVRQEIIKNQYDVVIGFQTRNPMHRSHVELTKHAYDQVKKDNVGKKCHLLITPAVGLSQDTDVPAHVRIKCYMATLQEYYQDIRNSVSLVLIPLAMRMAGPREAVWHALIRKNYGCTHFIVGRDHAGPSTKTEDGKPFYGTYEAQELLCKVSNDLGIKVVAGKQLIYVESADGAGEGRYVEEDQELEDGVKPRQLSGTEFRALLSDPDLPVIPSWYCSPKVVDILRTHYKPRDKQGLCVYFTGLSGAGKSTLAEALSGLLMEHFEETRRTTILDADIVRTHLSKGLGFSKEDRSMNVRRIGFVASEIVKHGGICLVANIAPYREDRAWNRKMVTNAGGCYVEVYVCTSLSTCLDRDAKQLYARAKAGKVTNVTGLDDPYEIPENPEITIDCSNDGLRDKARDIFNWLAGRKFIIIHPRHSSAIPT